MARILNIETSTTVCSVNIAEGGKKIIGKETNEQNAHSKVLTVFIDDIMKETGLNTKDLDALAVSKGPGSYTGLRIGVSAAKGIVYGGNIQLLSVSTLQSMAWGMKHHERFGDTVLFAPMIDARRMEVYTQLFDFKLNPLNEISAKIINKDSFSEELKKTEIIFFGDGAGKCKDVIQNKNAVFIQNMNPSADFMIPFSEDAFRKGKFEDVAYFEPFYLKDFIASVPKKNIFG